VAQEEGGDVGGVLGLKAGKEERGERRFHFLFQTYFPKSLSNSGLNKFDLWIFESFTSINMNQHECNKNITLNLY
jgi:hypothetical protein